MYNTAIILSKLICVNVVMARMICSTLTMLVFK